MILYRFWSAPGSVLAVQDSTVEDETGVEALYRAQARRMWRALYAFTGDPEVASDSLAEAFARALRYHETIRDLPSWLWRVSFRLANAELKRRSVPDGHSDPRSYEMPDPVPELIAALRRLTPNQRVAVVLHDYADRTTREVAETLGCSRATVHVHLSRGRRRLHDLLEEKDA
jgi:RNA polymerase sigma-70 factor (ECF subfamily)